MNLLREGKISTNKRSMKLQDRRKTAVDNILKTDNTNNTVVKR